MADFDPADAILGKKIVEYGDDGDTWTKIAGTKEAKFPEAERGKAEFTNDDSEDDTKEYLPSWFEPGSASVSYVYSPSQYADLEAIFQLPSNEATKYWRVTLDDGSMSVYKAFITKHPLPLDIESVPMVEMELQVSGKMTFTPGSGS